MRFWTLRRKVPSHEIETAERSLRRLEDVDRRLKRDERKLLRLEQSVLKILDSASALVERSKSISEEVAEDVRDGRLAIAQAEKAMDALRAALDVAEKVTVPKLTSQLEEIRSSSEANIALSNYRRATATPRRNDGEI